MFTSYFTKNDETFKKKCNKSKYGNKLKLIKAPNYF